MKTRVSMFVSASILTLCAAQAASAQTQTTPPAEEKAPAPESDDTETREIVVTARDHAGLLETRPTSTVFGVDKSLLETPRSASFVSSVTLDRYGVQNITDLAALTPGAATAMWYGVPGSLNIRGTMSDNYFRGFSRLPNWGTYATPMGAASEVQIVRGPPSAIYGAGKVGGFTNFIPKTAQTADLHLLTEIEAQAEVTVGSYSRTNVNGQIGVPVTLGGVQGGLFTYVEVEDSDSYYINAYREHTLVQASGVFDLGGDVRLEFGGMYYYYNGARPVVNRVTQNLIDNGVYETGRDTTLVDLDGNGRLTPNEAGGAVNFSLPYTTAVLPARNTLDIGVGTTQLDHRTIFWSDDDFSNSKTQTYYADIGKAIGDSTIKFQLFYDKLDHQRANSYGVPARYLSEVGEARLSGDFKLDFGEWLTTSNVVGASFRKFDGVDYETYKSAFLALDRRDLSYGATPTDNFDSPFTTEPGGIGLTWETIVDTKYDETALFGVADIDLFEAVNVIAAGRYDWWNISSVDSGTQAGAIKNITYEDSQGDFTYSLSASLTLVHGFMPYYTHASASALETNQAGGVNPSLITQNAWLSASLLDEVGVKFELMNGVLVGALSGYRQERTKYNQLNDTVEGEIAKGLELELRWLASRSLSFTLTGNTQRTEVKGPITGSARVGPYYTGRTCAETCGGNYSIPNLSVLIGRGNYKYTLIPDEQVSFFGNYTSPELSWGRVGSTVGIVYTGETKMYVPGGVNFHDRAIVNASVYATFGKTTLTLGTTNAFDKKYYMPASDAFANSAAIPGLGREWRITLRHRL
jgi:iron complex outermembrane receptor protein